MSTPNDVLKKQLHDAWAQKNGYKVEYERLKKEIKELERLAEIGRAVEWAKDKHGKFLYTTRPTVAMNLEAYTHNELLEAYQNRIK